MAPLLNMRYEKERYNLKINKSILIFKITTSIVNETLEKKKKKKKNPKQDLNILRSHVIPHWYCTVQ